MILECLACGRKNRVPDVPRAHGNYNCAACGQIFPSLDAEITPEPAHAEHEMLVDEKDNNAKFSQDPLVLAKQLKERIQASNDQLDLVFALESAIILASERCSTHLTGLRLGETPSESDMLVFYEFIYFFSHVILRYASIHKFSEADITKIQDYLGPSLSRFAVDKFCAHWPPDHKLGIRQEFYENLNRAEVEYSRCVGLSSGPMPSRVFTGDSLLSTLGRNMAELVGQELSPITMSEVQSVTIDAIAALHFDEKVARIAEYGNLTYDFERLQSEIDRLL